MKNRLDFSRHKMGSLNSMSLNPFCLDSMYSESTLKRKYSVVIERDEDGFLVADVPELEGCHTQAKTMPVLMKRVREAIELYLEDDPIGLPEK